MDLGPTFAEIAGREMPEVEGRSLWSTMRGQHPKDWIDETYSELCDPRGGFLPSRMIRSGKWKLWFFADSENLPPAMFNLEDDPGELHDLGQDPRYAEIRSQLLAKVQAGWNPGRSSSHGSPGERGLQNACPLGQDGHAPLSRRSAGPAPSYEDDVELR